jgi:hypothetical protein
MTKVPFKAEELKVGDIITMPRLDRKEEAQRWLIVDSDRSLLRVIVLLDSGNRYGWLGKLMTFAKSEIDTDKWRLLC